MDEVPNLPINEMRDALGEGWGLDKDEVAERLKRLLNKVADMPAEKRAHLLKSLIDRHEQPDGAWALLLSPYTLVAVAVTVVVMIFLFLAYKIFQREVEKKRKQEEKKKLKQEKKKK